MIKDRLQKIINLALESLGIDEPVSDLHHPANSEYGDFATGIALKYAKKLKTSSMDLAEKIKNAISRDELIKEVSVVKPGFVNISLSEKTLIDETVSMLEEMSGKKPYSAKKSVLIEFGQPNTHKIPHIGHLYSYILGESLARIFEHTGNKVYRTNWQGDIGLHVAKCLYIVKGRQKTKSLKTLRDKIDFLQKCYQEGSGVYEKSKKAEKEIDELNLKIYRHDISIEKLWKETRQWSLDFYKLFENKLGIRYDKYYFESQGGPVGVKIVKENIGKIFEESEGAVVFRGEKYELHTRVFINKYGNPTYEAKEIGLNSMKIKDFAFDLSLITTASEQNSFFKVAIKASELIFPQLKDRLKHLGFGMINLAAGKMSSRSGRIIDAFSLVDEIKNRVKSSFDISDDGLCEKIALSAIKYSFLKSDPFKNIVFDLEKSVAKEGDSGPYLLYTFVRTQSVLKQPDAASINDERSFEDISLEERALLRYLYRFPEIIEKALNVYSPHFIASYLFKLAQAFNLFYQKHPILKSDKKQKQLRLFLTRAVGETIRKGLYLLGIETVNKM